MNVSSDTLTSLVGGAHCSRDKGCIIAVSGVPVAPIEDPNGVIVFDWKASEKSDEADIIVYLLVGQLLTVGYKYNSFEYQYLKLWS